jgi:hypothetical protein
MKLKLKMYFVPILGRIAHFCYKAKASVKVMRRKIIGTFYI